MKIRVMQRMLHPRHVMIHTRMMHMHIMHALRCHVVHRHAHHLDVVVLLPDNHTSPLRRLLNRLNATLLLLILLSRLSFFITKHFNDRSKSINRVINSPTVVPNYLTVEAERGAERAENRVMRSGAMSARCRKRRGAEAEREVAERGTEVPEIGLSTKQLFRRSRCAHAALTCSVRDRHHVRDNVFMSTCICYTCRDGRSTSGFHNSQPSQLDREGDDKFRKYQCEVRLPLLYIVDYIFIYVTSNLRRGFQNLSSLTQEMMNAQNTSV